MGRGFNLLVGTAVFAGGAYVYSGMSKDGHENMNLDVGGIYQYGDCAKYLANPEVREPSTGTQLLETIRNVGRICGFCLSDTELNFGGASYKICIDPETIDLREQGYARSETGVEAYMTTLPESPEGYLFTAMDTNPGICSAAIGSLEKEMREYLNKTFVESIAVGLVPNVHIAPGSNHPCENTLPPPQG